MPGKRWKETEVSQLRRQWKRHGRLAKLRVDGRSRNSIKRKLLREGLLESGDEVRKPWNASEGRTLKSLVAKGMTAEEIHRSGRLDRTRDSIAQKISRMKLLAGKRQSRMLRDCRRLHGAELAEFLAAVDRYGETRHTQWFVWKFAVGRGKVKRTLAREGVIVTWKDAMQLPQTRMHFVQRVSEASARVWEKRRESTRDGLVAHLHEFEERLRKNPKLKRRAEFHERVCATCGGHWFASQVFFKPSIKRLPGGGRKEYLRRSCRICTSGQRGTPDKGRRNETLERREWREKLLAFENSLVEAHPTLFAGDGPSGVLRWEPFIATLEKMAAPEIVALASRVISIYQNAGVNQVLGHIEKTCFDGDPELHIDVWELDEMIRRNAEGSVHFVRQHKLLEPGRALAIRLYRVLRLPAYAGSLI